MARLKGRRSLHKNYEKTTPAVTRPPVDRRLALACTYHRLSMENSKSYPSCHRLGRRRRGLRRSGRLNHPGADPARCPHSE